MFGGALATTLAQHASTIGTSLAQHANALNERFVDGRVGTAPNTNKDFQEDRVVLPGGLTQNSILRVGSTDVRIDRHLAEGGFAHVYVVSTGESTRTVLKRMIIPDEERLNEAKMEITVLKRLNGHKNIVSFYDASVKRLPASTGGGYEALILMEYCSGGQVVELMNSRLDVRLNEMEILKIFSEVVEAVAALHYSRPPIVHRDIKVENVLISHSGTYKLSDFGSATTRLVSPGTPLSAREITQLEEELTRYTTAQYRAPEMVDLYGRKGLSEKTDVWALGILLYKLCFYTTPFEDGSRLAILNGKYHVPSSPRYRDEIINLIANMLSLEPANRFNIYGVLFTISQIRGCACSIQNVSI
ncbi:kinase-like protein [Gonapodya prolifera JEL478]|uniref:non-specific serine/threonine protein kinase n=1 Tax=Gonapodya prolifera (strain JEL478) TaxID=1344416 RepID=A0A139A547_GONPJ|nr:kinase-like protein [Gonapodya prolifera JEL478]|eukprot:KXS11910.1 kinase-like protein [Gonapodya prolifera JEL478]